MRIRSVLITVVAAFACAAALDGESITGILTDHGEPAANVKVAAVDSDKHQLEPTFTDRDGLYVLNGINRAKSYALRVWVDRDHPIDFPFVTSIKPSNEQPPLEIRGATESQKERELGSDEITTFLRQYYQVYQRGDVKQLASMYGDFVDYYENGNVSREFIATDKGNFIQYFKKRDFKLKPDIEVFPTLSSSEKRVRFTYSFLVAPTQPRMTKPRDSKEVWTLRRVKGRIQIVRCISDRMGS
jgi:hypothetical protein